MSRFWPQVLKAYAFLGNPKDPGHVCAEGVRVCLHCASVHTSGKGLGSTSREALDNPRVPQELPQFPWRSPRVLGEPGESHGGGGKSSSRKRQRFAAITAVSISRFKPSD